MTVRDPERHAAAVSGMFGRIARFYDLLNHTLSLGQDIVWRKRLAEFVVAAPGEAVLDLAAGTLDVTREVLGRHPGTSVLAVDFARPMLERGAAKLTASQAGRVQIVQADGRRLPAADASVASVTIAFGIRNIRPRSQALEEIFRVLAPGGRLCVLEFGSGKNRIWGGLYNFYLRRLLPLVGRMVSRDPEAYTYLAETIADFPTARELGREMQEAGFGRVLWQPLLSGICWVHVAEKPA